MTTLEEQIVLMDYLRANRGMVGGQCGNTEDGWDHDPELCEDEVEEWQDWEAAMRAPDAGDLVNETYHTVRDLAKADWQQRHQENWNAGPVMQGRVQAWGEWFERASAHPPARA